jgi:predicted DNA-binding protein (MmcQ/YjbR family)
MVTTSAFRKMALAYEGAVELPHFENASFRVSKKIFATLNARMSRACLKLDAENQSLFCSYPGNVIYPVPNKWGKQGWTLVELRKISTALMKDVLRTAYCGVAPKKLAALYRHETGTSNP